MTYISSSSDCPRCGSEHKGKPFCIYPNGYHCFSCGLSKNADRSFIIRDIHPNIPKFPKCLWEPSAFTLSNRAWLLKYFVDDSDIRKYHIGQTEDGALLFPYIDNKEVVCYQTRLNLTSRIIKSYGEKTPALYSIGAKTLVIVEDFISAIRIAEHTDSVCLWGTKAPFLSLKEWCRKYSNILVWLDNDESKKTNSGQIAAEKICKTLKSILSFNNRKWGFGGAPEVTIRNIVTKEDPKCHTNSEIKEIIGAQHALPTK